jgi:hypothetical protein
MRNELRVKLYTGRTKVAKGRGGAPIPESCADERKPGLVQMWPKYLTPERAASKPTLSDPSQTPLTRAWQSVKPEPGYDPLVRVVITTPYDPFTTPS